MMIFLGTRNLIKNITSVREIILKNRCFLLLREQTWVRSALWGVQYHQLAHGYIYEQLNLVVPGICDVSNSVLAAHR